MAPRLRAATEEVHGWLETLSQARVCVGGQVPETLEAGGGGRGALGTGPWCCCT